MWEALPTGLLTLTPFVLALVYLACRRRTPLRADPALVASLVAYYEISNRDVIGLCCRLSYVAEDDAYALNAYHITLSGELHFAGRVQVAHAELCHMAICSPTPAMPCDVPTSGTCYGCCVVGCMNAISAVVATDNCLGCTHPDAEEAVPEEIAAYVDRFMNHLYRDIDLLEITSTDKISNQVLTTAYSRVL
jgi:hypothetical protein